MSTHDRFRTWQVAVGVAAAGAMAIGGSVLGVPESATDATPQEVKRLISEAGGNVSGIEPQAELLIVPVMPPAGEPPYPPGWVIEGHELILPAGADKGWFELQVRRLAPPGGMSAASIEDEGNVGMVAAVTCPDIFEIPSGKCCTLKGCCDVDGEAECTGDYTAGSFCSNDPNDPCADCPEPGKCCVPNSECHPVQCEAECTQMSGYYTAEGECTNEPCEDCPEPGKCCLPDNTCVDEDDGIQCEADCTALGGEYTFEETCDEDPCEDCSNPGCCRSGNGLCLDVDCEAECADDVFTEGACLSSENYCVDCYGDCETCSDGCASTTSTKFRAAPVGVCAPAACVMVAWIDRGREEFLPGGQAHNLFDAAGPYFVIEYPVSSASTPLTEELKYLASVAVSRTATAAARGESGETASGGSAFTLDLEFDLSDSFLKDAIGQDIPFQTSPGKLTILPQEPVPAVSTWGLVGIALLLLTGAKIYFGRRHVKAA